MSIPEFFYTIFISPLELLFEVVFYYANLILRNPALSIIVMSLVMNFFVLSLYIRADKMQEEEKETEERLAKGVSHIKKTFRGNERFYMLQTYYRQNGYRPVYALRGSIPLLLEIPFFIAAYHFLSNLSLLKGASFGHIADLGEPDALLSLGGISVNLLPILMTAINLISGMVYARKLSAKSKVQLWVIAGVFLILLYRSPAGLVFYWTLNNVFSLLKNIFFMLKKPEAQSEKESLSEDQKESPSDSSIFLWAGLFLAVLLGVLIPGNVIVSSVAEFVDVDNPVSPLGYVWVTFLMAAGYFLIWFRVFFSLMDKKGKRILTIFAVCLSVVGVVDYMVFQGHQGTLSELLQYERGLTFTISDYLINLIVVLVLVFICSIAIRRSRKLILTLLIAAVFAMAVISIKNLIVIDRDYKETSKRAAVTDEIPTLSFSRQGKNVVVLMVDSLASYYVPYMLEEKPELKESFDGFTYYPNTVSLGCQTNFGSPGLYGGYEYTPKEMNKRDSELLVDKQNEALKIMPVVFYEDDYKVTVCDPTYAGYSDVPDLTIYDDYPGIDAYITMGRVGKSDLTHRRVEEILRRNFFLYGACNVSPTLFKKIIYDNGNYCFTLKGAYYNSNQAAGGQVMETLSSAIGVNPGFMKQYNVLDNLSNISDVVADDADHFIMMSNSLPHNPMLVQEPEYEPQYRVDNADYDAEHRIKSKADGSSSDFYDPNNYPRYQANMAAMLKLGQWFDYLKENGIWDNTKIIIVSDHAWRLGDLAGMKKYFGFEVDKNIPGSTEEADFSIFNCSLLVKDFNAKGFETDNTFMTNADVPTIAFQDVVDDPVNPFTGKAIDSSYKQNNKLELHMGVNFNVGSNNGFTFLPDHWFSVHDNIFDMDNWEYLGCY